MDCDVRFACHGECPKNRFIATLDGQSGLNYLCAGFKDFFHHVDQPMRVMVEAIRSGNTASPVMAYMAQSDASFATAVAKAGRNDPCPCGSGVKTKKCHGLARANATGESPEMPSEPGKPRARVGKRRED